MNGSLIAVLIFLAFFVVWVVTLHYERKRANYWRDRFIDSHKQIAGMHEEWHARNEEMRQTREERDSYRGQLYASLEELDRKHETIKRLCIACQIARVQLRDFCSRPSQMMDILDKLEKDFVEDSKSN